MQKGLLSFFALVSVNYFIGYFGSFLLKERTKDVVAAVIFNVGMRNTSFGSVLAIAYFPPEVTLPIILTLLYQHPIAALVPTCWTVRGKRLIIH